uniref:Jasmonate O-methyltransferase n=1 Tax=Cucumis melo TaxID=3656 RepID=A0A9I9CI07_CUCME
MEVAQILCMNKGGGETSYARNSSLQSKIISDSKRITEEAVESMITTFSNNNTTSVISIADLGCSSGPNTLLLVSDTLNLIYSKCKRLGYPLPEVQVFLNDLFSNDFNYIFGSLPEFHRRLVVENGGEVGPCFISGVPGSFYGRLFPKKSLNFVHSSSSLHWLSEVPEGLLEGEGKRRLNKGKLYISSTSPRSVVEAYGEQFKSDFGRFIKSRSEEMVSDGRMVLSLMGRKSMDPTTPDSCHHWELLAQALTTLASQGLVEEDKIDSFNAPYYAPCMEEVKEEIEKEGSFMVERFEAFEVEWDGFASEAEDGLKILTRGQRVAKTIRAVVETMLESHFGGRIIDALFQHYGTIVQHYLSNNRTKYTNLVVSFVKK